MSSTSQIEELEEAVIGVQKALQADLMVYSGGIERDGYFKVCDLLASRRPKQPHVLLVLATLGGDPHAGFRLARALRHNYSQLHVLVPGLCKSAGTLVVTGATELIIADTGELGPLDVQVAKRDEVFEFGSGLDIMQACNYLQSQALTAYRDYLIEMRMGAGMSTKMAAEIAASLVGQLYSPVAAQVDPLRLGEMYRAMQIAHAYGERLNEYNDNLKAGALEDLVSGYPAHGFVIDRREAKRLFKRVRKPNELEVN